MFEIGFGKIRSKIMKKFSVAIDGPAGAGKSSIAKMLAKKLGCIYIDTGAMYRSVGLYCIKNGVDYENEEAVERVLPAIKLRLEVGESGQMIFLNDEDVSRAIRTDEVAASASKVATYGKVREALVALQQEMERQQSVVMDGRDIGTVVMPNATLKIYLTASVSERALRRFKEYEEKGRTVSLEILTEEIQKRDEQDMTRAISPLTQAEDAIVVDTTTMAIEEVVVHLSELLEARL